MGEKGMGILKQYQDGTLSPEQLTSLRTMVVSRQHSLQQQQQNVLRQQQQGQQHSTPNQNANPNPNANAGGSQMANVSDEHLLKGTQDLMGKLAKLQSSIGTGGLLPDQQEKARNMTAAWSKQLAQATAECSRRGLSLNVDLLKKYVFLARLYLSSFFQAMSAYDFHLSPSHSE
jgi:hypothetical protein